MKKLISITYKTELDEFADLSYIGTFDDKPKDEFAINHKERNGGRNSYEWFNPQPGTCETQEHAEQAYNRLIEFESGYCSTVGIRAIAHVRTSNDGISWQGHEIQSPGLWGIESDSDKTYLDDIKCEQFRDLADSLREFGFTQEEIESAPVTDNDNA
jgi:hypothetical protein